MRLLASLTNRIFIAASALAVVTTAVAVYVVGLRTTREAEVELDRGVREAGELMAEQRRALTSQSLLTARLLADLPTLKGAVETRHAETVPIASWSAPTCWRRAIAWGRRWRRCRRRDGPRPAR
jgi:hypothetical protein